MHLQAAAAGSVGAGVNCRKSQHLPGTPARAGPPHREPNCFLPLTALPTLPCTVLAPPCCCNPNPHCTTQFHRATRAPKHSRAPAPAQCRRCPGWAAPPRSAAASPALRRCGEGVSGNPAGVARYTLPEHVGSALRCAGECRAGLGRAWQRWEQAVPRCTGWCSAVQGRAGVRWETESLHHPSPSQSPTCRQSSEPGGTPMPKSTCASLPAALLQERDGGTHQENYQPTHATALRRISSLCTPQG